MLRMAAVPFGISFVFGAAMLIFAACGVVPSAQVFTAAAWPWVVTVATIFATLGLGCVLWGLGFDAMAAILLRSSVAVVAAGFILALNWVAFGPGVRQFGISVGPSGGSALAVPMDAATNELAGRTVFGIVAAVFDLIVLLVVVSWGVYWRNNRRRKNNGPSAL